MTDAVVVESNITSIADRCIEEEPVVYTGGVDTDKDRVTEAEHTAAHPTNTEVDGDLYSIAEEAPVEAATKSTKMTDERIDSEATVAMATECAAIGADTVPTSTENVENVTMVDCDQQVDDDEQSDVDNTMSVSSTLLEDPPSPKPVDIKTPIKTRRSTSSKKKNNTHNAPSKTYKTRGSRQNKSPVRSTPIKKRIVSQRGKTMVDEQLNEIKTAKSDIVALQNAVKLLELTVKNQQSIIAKLQETKTECGACSNVRNELEAARTELITFYKDNDKTCARNNSLLKKDLQNEIKKVLSVASDTKKRLEDLQNSTTTPPSTCPQSTAIGANTLGIERVSDEVKSIKETLKELPLKDGTVVEDRQQKSRKKQMAKDLPGNTAAPPDRVTDKSIQFGDVKNSPNKGASNSTHNNRSSFNSQKKNIILFMDSNRNYIDPCRLWENLTIVPAGNISELTKKLEQNDLRNYDVVVIHVGVNDIDRVNGRTVAKQLIDLTSRIKSSAPGVKIILSQVTPRQLYKDDEVQACNAELDVLKDAENITIAKHNNLRDDKWSFHKPNDDKHFTNFAVARLAGNLKSAFRKAMGFKPRYQQSSFDNKRTPGGMKPIRRNGGYKHSKNNQWQGNDDKQSLHC